MRHWNKILFIENNIRIKNLERFRDLVVEYFENSRVDLGAAERIEEPRAGAARVEINRMMALIRETMLCAGVSPVVISTPSPATGGYIQEVNIISNIFSLNSFRIEPSKVIDFLDRAIGIYQKNTAFSIIRSMSPFFYLGWILSVLMRAPFFIWGEAGFDRERAERSIWGRLVKVGVGLISVSASLRTLFEHRGYWESIKRFLGI